MSSAMHKMAIYLGLVEEEDRYDDYDQYDENDRGDSDRDPGRDGRRDRIEPAAGRGPAREGARVPSGASVMTLPDRGHPAPQDNGGTDLSRITTLHPRTYNEARAIGEQFREGTPVIMNLTEMDDSDAKRLVDFSAGLIFGLRGTIERVTAKVFLLSPANVEVTAEDKARIAEGGFFNQS